MFKHLFMCKRPELHSSVGSVADLRTGGFWFDPRLGQYSFRGLMIVIATGFISFLFNRCPLFRQWFCGKAAIGLERMLCGLLVKKLQESMDRFTGHRDISEILLKKGVKHHTVNKSCVRAAFCENGA